MSEQNQDIKAIEQALKEPLPVDAIEWRVSRCGKKQDGSMWAMVLAYKTSRADMDRLDAVCGIGGWQDQIKEVNHGLLCGVGINVGDEWIWKWDGASETDFESFKGGISGAFKRACSKWGIGRYLYNLTETFVEVTPQKQYGPEWNYVNWEDKKKKIWITGYWKTPELPEWAKPQAEPKHLTPNLDKFFNIMKANAAKLPEPFRADARVIVGKKQEITDEKLRELEAAIYEHVENFDNGVK